jgi:hypothetical protein
VHANGTQASEGPLFAVSHLLGNILDFSSASFAPNFQVVDGWSSRDGKTTSSPSQEFPNHSMLTMVLQYFNIRAEET